MKKGYPSTSALRIIEKTNLKIKTMTRGTSIAHKKPKTGVRYLTLMSFMARFQIKWRY
jgi:hypothetical protein